MVAISKSIATKIKDKQGDVTDDEVGICENMIITNFWYMYRYNPSIASAICSINMFTNNLGKQVCIDTCQHFYLS